MVVAVGWQETLVVEMDGTALMTLEAIFFILSSFDSTLTRRFSSLMVLLTCSFSSCSLPPSQFLLTITPAIPSSSMHSITQSVSSHFSSISTSSASPSRFVLWIDEMVGTDSLVDFGGRIRHTGLGPKEDEGRSLKVGKTEWLSAG